MENKEKPVSVSEEVLERALETAEERPEPEEQKPKGNPEPEHHSITVGGPNGTSPHG